MAGEWSSRGGTLTDGTACAEYGLAKQDIVEAIQRGELQFRWASIFGNPALRLLRSEVEDWVGRTRGAAYLQGQKARVAKAQADLALKRQRKRLAELEARRGNLG